MHLRHGVNEFSAKMFDDPEQNQGRVNRHTMMTKLLHQLFALDFGSCEQNRRIGPVRYGQVALSASCAMSSGELNGLLQLLEASLPYYLVQFFHGEKGSTRHQLDIDFRGTPWTFFGSRFRLKNPRCRCNWPHDFVPSSDMLKSHVVESNHSP
jgi:hypothetical protein